VSATPLRDSLNINDPDAMLPPVSAAGAKVRRCRLTPSYCVLKAPMVLALEATIVSIKTRVESAYGLSA
jgi:hypothetical protein